MVERSATSGALFVPNYAWRIGPIILGGRAEMIGPAATAAVAAKSAEWWKESAAERMRNRPNGPHLQRATRASTLVAVSRPSTTDADGCVWEGRACRDQVISSPRVCTRELNTYYYLPFGALYAE